MKSIEQKRKEAQQRAHERSSRRLSDQLSLLDKRPGNSAKEKLRIHVAISAIILDNNAKMRRNENSQAPA